MRKRDFDSEGPTQVIPVESFESIKLAEARASIRSMELEASPTEYPVYSLTSERPTRNFGPTRRIEILSK